MLAISEIRQRDEKDKLKTRKKAPWQKGVAKAPAKHRSIRALLQRQRNRQKPSDEAPNEQAAGLTEGAAGEVLSDASHAFTAAKVKAKTAFRQKRQKELAGQAKKTPEAPAPEPSDTITPSVQHDSVST